MKNEQLEVSDAPFFLFLPRKYFQKKRYTALQRGFSRLYYREPGASCPQVISNNICNL